MFSGRAGPAAVDSAVAAYVKINSARAWIDRTVSLNQLFDRMSTRELEDYAQKGALPPWFKAMVGEADQVSRRANLPWGALTYPHPHPHPHPHPRPGMS